MKPILTLPVHRLARPFNGLIRGVQLLAAMCATGRHDAFAALRDGRRIVYEMFPRMALQFALCGLKDR